MRSRGAFPLAVVVIIAAVSLGVAVVTFGWLDSSGTSTSGGAQLAGAIVGFVVSFLALMTAYRTLMRIDQQRAHQELADHNKQLQDQIDHLSQQLIRSAPRPEGYSVELLEHHRLVLARPKHYETRGGVILDIQEPDIAPLPDGDLMVDPVPARLWVTFTPLQDEKEPEAYYRHYVATTKDNPRYDVMAAERTVIGSDAATCDALRITTRRCSRVTMRCDVSGRIQRSPAPLPVADWATIDDGPIELRLTAEDLTKPGFEVDAIVRVRQSMVVCLHPQLERIFFFAFEDDESKFVETVEALNQCLRSVRFLV